MSRTFTLLNAQTDIVMDPAKKIQANTLQTEDAQKLKINGNAIVSDGVGDVDVDILAANNGYVNAKFFWATRIDTPTVNSTTANLTTVNSDTINTTDAYVNTIYATAASVSTLNTTSIHTTTITTPSISSSTTLTIKCDSGGLEHNQQIQFKDGANNILAQFREFEDVGQPCFQINGATNLSSLTASRPLQLDASKNIIADAIDLSNLNNTSNILPVSRGGSGLAVLNGKRIIKSADDGSGYEEMGAQTNGQLIIGNTGNAPSISTLSGTANQILVNNGAGSITLSTPQDINTTSAPTFNGITTPYIKGSTDLTLYEKDTFTGLFLSDANNGWLSTGWNHNIYPVEMRARDLADKMPTIALCENVNPQYACGIGLSVTGNHNPTGMGFFAGGSIDNATPIDSTTCRMVLDTNGLLIKPTDITDYPLEALHVKGNIRGNNVKLDGSGNVATISSLASSAKTYTIEDISSSNFILSEGAQTMNGNKTLSGTINLSSLTASRPLQLDASKNIVASAINLSDTNNTTANALPVSRGGTNITSLNGKRVLMSSADGLSMIESSALTNGQLIVGNTGNTPSLSTLTGTANQISVTNGAGSITLSVPQDIHTGATPSFSTVNLNTLTASRPLQLDGSKNIVSGGIDLSDLNNTTANALPVSRGGTNITSLNGNRVLLSSADGLSMIESSALTNGQLIVGNTGNTPSLSTLTGTANQISIANGAGSITLSVPQDIHTGATPSFSTVNLNTLTASRPLQLDGSKNIVASAINLSDTNNTTANALPVSRGGTNITSLNGERVLLSSTDGLSVSETSALTNGQLIVGNTGNTPSLSTLTGTANQISVANGAGSITLATPQDIHTGATPSFATVNLNTLTASRPLQLDGSKNIVASAINLSDTNNTTANPLPIGRGGTNITSLNGKRVLLSSADGLSMIESSALTNGQLIVGNTGNTPSLSTLTGTANQISVTNGAGSITLSAPQDIGTGSTPTFNGIVTPYVKGNTDLTLYEKDSFQGIFISDANNGWTSIGTNHNIYPLEMRGRILSDKMTTIAIADGTNPQFACGIGLSVTAFHNPSGMGFFAGGSGDNDTPIDSTTCRMVLDTNGLLIHPTDITDYPLEQLHVKGNIRGNNVKLDGSGSVATISSLASSDKTYTIPDINASNFILSEGNQTINGSKKITGALHLSDNHSLIQTDLGLASGRYKISFKDVIDNSGGGGSVDSEYFSFQPETTAEDQIPLMKFKNPTSNRGTIQTYQIEANTMKTSYLSSAGGSIQINDSDLYINNTHNLSVTGSTYCSKIQHASGNVEIPNTLEITGSMSTLSAPTVKTASNTGHFELPHDTRRGMSADYDTSVGDTFGVEQVSNVQTGDGAQMRIFSAGSADYKLAFGHYTDATTFVNRAIINQAGEMTVSKIITTTSTTLKDCVLNYDIQTVAGTSGTIDIGCNVIVLTFAGGSHNYVFNPVAPLEDGAPITIYNHSADSDHWIYGIGNRPNILCVRLSAYQFFVYGGVLRYIRGDA